MRESNGFIIDVERKQTKVKVFYFVLYTFFILWSLVFILPIAWMFLSSFKGTQEFLNNATAILPKEFDLTKLGRVWLKSGVWRSYLTTSGMVAGSLVFCIISNGLAGYVLSRLKPKGSNLVFVLVMWSMMMPENLGMVPRFISFIEMPILRINLLNTYWPMWFMAGANAFHAMIFKSFFDGISRSYLEAARIDGCSELRIFSNIIIPLSKPVMMSVAIFCVTDTWGAFLWPYLIVTERQLQPLGVLVFSMKRELAADEYLMMLMFVIIPPIIFFLLFQKYIMEGVSLGGIKG